MPCCHCLPPSSLHVLGYLGLFQIGLPPFKWYGMIYCCIGVTSTNLFFICFQNWVPEHLDFHRGFNMEPHMFAYIKHSIQNLPEMCRGIGICDVFTTTREIYVHFFFTKKASKLISNGYRAPAINNNMYWNLTLFQMAFCFQEIS